MFSSWPSSSVVRVKEDDLPTEEQPYRIGRDRRPGHSSVSMASACHISRAKDGAVIHPRRGQDPQYRSNGMIHIGSLHRDPFKFQREVFVE